MRMSPQGAVSSLCHRFLLSVLACCSASAHAENSDWSSQGLIYLLGPTLDGTSGIGPVDTEVDMDAGDVFDALDGAFLGMYRGQNNRWGVALDVVHMDLKGDATGDRGALSGTVSVRQSSVIASGYYRVSEEFRIIGGALYNDLATRVSLSGPLNDRNQKVSEDWVDPVIGVGYDVPLGESWDFSGSALVGGFGVGSDLVMVFSASFAYRFNDWSSISLGGRYLDFDYEDGQGADRFKFDMKQYGPAVGFRFDF